VTLKIKASYVLNSWCDCNNWRCIDGRKRLHESVAHYNRSQYSVRKSLHETRVSRKVLIFLFFQKGVAVACIQTSITRHTLVGNDNNFLISTHFRFGTW